MATLTIRDLPDDVRDKLRVRAARNGRSMEAEVRASLASLVADRANERAEEDIGARIASVQAEFRRYVPAGVGIVDGFLAERRRMWGDE